MTKTDLLALADKIEVADASEQRELLKAAWRKLRGDECVKTGVNHFYRFHARLDAEAYVDAALMLVPANCCVSAMGEVPDDLCWYVDLWREGEQDGEPEYRAQTLALAITAAALRARAEECE